MDSDSSFSSSSSSENNVGDGALFVIGPHGSGDAICPFPARLEGGKGGPCLLPCSPGHVVPGIACMKSKGDVARILSASCFAAGEGSES